MRLFDGPLCILACALAVLVAGRVAGAIATDEERINDLRNFLKGKHLIMMGDFIMRYQYLALAYALNYHALVANDMKKSVIDDANWGGTHRSRFNEHYFGTNNLLSPNEFCDCHRTYGKPQWMNEIRYYQEPQSEIAVTFYFWRETRLRGHWDIGEDNSLRYPSHRFIPHAWDEPVEGVMQKAANLTRALPWQPSSSIILLNFGFWDQNKFLLNEPDTLVGYMTAARSLFSNVVWKTTSHYAPGYQAEPFWGGTREDHDRRDSLMCSQESVLCMNISWTKDLPASAFRDHMDFKADSYNQMNFQLIDLLKDLHI
jgi:hypothetical protein